MSASTRTQIPLVGRRLTGFVLVILLTFAPLLTCCFAAASPAGHKPPDAHAEHGSNATGEHAGHPGAAALETAPAHDDDCRCPPCAAASHTAPQAADAPDREAEWGADIDALAGARPRSRRTRNLPPATGPPPAATLAAVTPYDLHDRQLD